MFKALFKIITVLGAAFAFLVGFSYWKKHNDSDYVEIYKDDEDDVF